MILIIISPRAKAYIGDHGLDRTVWESLKFGKQLLITSSPVLSSQLLEPLEAANMIIINLHPAMPGAYNGAVSPSLLLSLSIATHILFVFQVGEDFSAKNAIERAQ